MKVSETLLHYLGLFAGMSLWVLLPLLGWELAKHSTWFALQWESMANRWFFVAASMTGIIIGFTYFVSYFWGRKKIIRTFKSIERSQLRECQDGETVRIQGELLTLGEPLLATCSERPCAAFEARISRQKEVSTSSGSGSARTETIWETIELIKRSSDFLVQCDGSYALIRVKECKAFIHDDFVHDEKSYDKDSGGFLTEQENNKRKEVLTRAGIPYKEFTGVYAEEIKFEEGVLEQGEQVAVRGEGRWIKVDNSEELRSLREKGIPKVFEIKHSEASKLYISDSLDVLESIAQS